MLQMLPDMNRLDTNTLRHYAGAMTYSHGCPQTTNIHVEYSQLLPGAADREFSIRLTLAFYHSMNLVRYIWEPPRGAQ